MPLKKFNIVVGQTDAEGSPPPPPAPSGPVSSQERFISDGTYCPGDGYSSGPIAYSNQGAQAYYTKRYSSETGAGLPRYNSSYQVEMSRTPWIPKIFKDECFTFSSMYIPQYLNKIVLNFRHITQVDTPITLVIKTTPLRPPPRPRVRAGVDAATILTSITALEVVGWRP